MQCVCVCVIVHVVVSMLHTIGVSKCPLCLQESRCLSLPPGEPGVCGCVRESRCVSSLLLLLAVQLEQVLIILVVCLQQPVPPGECGGVVPNKVHVVEVVETGSSVEGDQVEGVQRNVITTERETGSRLLVQSYTADTHSRVQGTADIN